MAIQVKTAAKGNSADTGTPVSLPPVKIKGPDVVSQARLGGDHYGQNSGTSNPSSISVGEAVESDMAKSMRSAVNDEGLLDRIARVGVAKSGDSVDLQSPQTRKVSDTAYPAVHGQSSRQANSGSPGGAIPTKNGAVDSDYAARRAAQLKAGQ
jgi:hypothetical protein